MYKQLEIHVQQATGSVFKCIIFEHVTANVIQW